VTKTTLAVPEARDVLAEGRMDDTVPPTSYAYLNWPLLLVAALDARLLQQLTVLLLGHALTTLLDDRAHETLTR
jgi:hypothetical protein